MNALQASLIRRITQEGPLSLADYMTDCLCHPHWGYYTTREPFGVKGDFITAPEISQMFGEMIGVWAAIQWQQMGSPTKLHLIEMGPGRGTLMSDVLRATKAVPGFHAALEVSLLEISPRLKAIQEETLAECDHPITWRDGVGDIPDGPLIVLANEFFDALPIRQLHKVGGHWGERRVMADGEDLVYVTQASPAAQAMVPPLFAQSEDGAVFEVCPLARTIASGLAERLMAHPGAVLAIDYGHGSSATGDTFQALKDHQYHPPLENPGEADLTAHVDFDALAQAFRVGGSQVWPLITQREFLGRMGIGARAQALVDASGDDQAEQIAKDFARLVDEDEMGTLFKVMAVTSPNLPPPPGFEADVP